MNGDLAPFLLAALIESARSVTVARETRVRLMIAEPPTDFLEGGELGRLPSPARASATRLLPLQVAPSSLSTSLHRTSPRVDILDGPAPVCCLLSTACKPQPESGVCGQQREDNGPDGLLNRRVAELLNCERLNP